MTKPTTKPRQKEDIDIDNDIDIDKEINIMYKYIIFSELCPGEHNPRSKGNWEWGVSKRIGQGRSLRRGDLAFGDGTQPG